MTWVRTGILLALVGCATAVPSPSLGTPLALPWQTSGSSSRIAEGFGVRVSSEGAWKTLFGRMFGGAEAPPGLAAIDFRREEALVVSDGASFNCRGISASEVFDDGERILFRLHHDTYQTAGGEDRVRPYGIFVLPRQEGKTIVVETNTQSLIGKPPIWKERYRFRPQTPPK